MATIKNIKSSINKKELSRKFQPSYLKHFQLTKKHTALAPVTPKKAEVHWDEEEIATRSEKIISRFQKRDVSIIRIEQPSTESILPCNYLEQETKWLQKANLASNQLANAQEQFVREEKAIKTLEQELTWMKQRLKIIKSKASSSNRASQQTITDQQHQRLFNAQQQFDQFAQQNELVKRYKKDKEELVVEVQILQSQLEATRQDYQSLASNRPKVVTNQELTELATEEAKLRQAIVENEQECHHLQQKIQELAIKLNPTGQSYLKYLELQEKVYIIRELEKLERLMSLKDLEQVSQKQYQSMKLRLKQQKRSVKNTEKRINEKKQEIQKLTNKILEMSNILLSLY